MSLSVFLAAAGTPAARAQTHEIERADPNLLEAGSPLFSILTKETLGLDSPPTDLHLMPDGRVLVVAGPQLAFGDGVRWSVFQQADDDTPTRALTVAVDRDGQIYQALPDGFARVVFGEDRRWRLAKVADWPAGEGRDRPTPRTVITAGDHWLWHSNSGSILSWRPGQTAMTVGQATAVEQIFHFRGEDYLIDRVVADGTFIRMDGSGRKPQGDREPLLPHGLITTGLPFNDDRMLLGTTAHGIQVFDGRTARPLAAQGVLAGGQRINDLCQAGGGFYAAAVENYGVVFFDSRGRTIQSLNRTVDHRLGRVIRLIAAPSGMIWGLLTDGIFQIGFPSRVTYYEPLMDTGLGSAHPRRFDGKLWFTADNQVMRATYDGTGRLTGFERDSPEGEVVFTLSSLGGVPLGSTNPGAYFRSGAGWRRLVDATIDLRVLRSTPIDGVWPYAAREEVGWVRQTEEGPRLIRHPVPGLGHVYNANTDGNGNAWLERGPGLLGRLRPARPGGDAPQVDLYGPEQGVPNGWVQVFVVDGIARFNVADRILRLDEASGRLVPDDAFAREFQSYGTIVGRPGRDAFQRLWVTTERGIFIFEGELGRLKRVNEPMPSGFQPYYFTFESTGVVWFHSPRRLARYDPLFPVPSPEPLRALVTHVTLPSSGRTLFPQDGALPVLPYSDNTLILHFVASGAPLLDPVMFEVKLDGADQNWVAAGSAGSAVFNRLGEGEHTLLVRPSSLGLQGEVTALRFTITAPWYRTPWAYLGAAALLIATIMVIGRFFTYLERREKHRLEKVVTLRTRELHESNVRLATQVEENRTLSQAIQQSPVGVILVKPDGTMVFANSRVCELSGYTLAELAGRPIELLAEPGPRQQEQSAGFARARQAGDSWQAHLVNRTKDGRQVHVRITASPLKSQQGDIALYLVLEEDITESLAEQERRRRLEAQLFQAQKRESLGTLAGGIAHDFNNILTGILGYCELARLTLGTESAVEQELVSITSAGRRARDLVSQILSFTRPGNPQLAPLDLAQPVAEALRLFRASTPANVELVQTLESGGVRADASQIHQVILNLCTNAAHAMRRKPGRIDVRLEPVKLDAAQAAEFGAIEPGDYMRLRVVDNGCGMEPAVMDRIFDPFFTTKEPGEGTGLGLPIVQGIVSAHRGGLRVKSEPGAGTTFDAVFPVTHEARPVTRAVPHAPAGGNEELLIVDDEAMVTDFVAARLRQLGYRPTVVNDPRAALDALVAEPHRFGALITDLTMPHLSGVELIGRLRHQGVRVPTLIITGYNRNSARADLASVPDVPVLQKPFTGDELAQAVHRVLAGK